MRKRYLSIPFQLWFNLFYLCNGQTTINCLVYSCLKMEFFILTVIVIILLLMKHISTFSVTSSEETVFPNFSTLIWTFFPCLSCTLHIFLLIFTEMGCFSGAHELGSCTETNAVISCWSSPCLRNIPLVPHTSLNVMCMFSSEKAEWAGVLFLSIRLIGLHFLDANLCTLFFSVSFLKLLLISALCVHSLLLAFYILGFMLLSQSLVKPVSKYSILKPFGNRLPLGILLRVVIKRGHYEIQKVCNLPPNNIKICFGNNVWDLVYIL